MAVLKVLPNLTSAPQDGKKDELAEREYRVTYLVQTDDPLDGPEVVLRAPGLPIIGATYSFANDIDLGALVRSLNARRLPDERLLWEVEVTYSSRNQGDDIVEQNPLDRPAKKRWSTEPYQRIIHHDRFGSPIFNSAHDTFDPPIMIDDMRLTLIYTRNEATNDIPFIFSFANAVNSDVFYGFQPGEVKLTHIESEEEKENNVIFWVTTYEFHFRRTITNPQAQIYKPNGNSWQQIPSIPPWSTTPLNVGFHELKSGKLVRITDTSGKPTPVPLRLNIDGTRMSASATPSQSVFLSFECYDVKPFTALGIS